MLAAANTAMHRPWFTRRPHWSTPGRERKENELDPGSGTVPSLQHAANASRAINTQLTSKQQAFLAFVLPHYVNVGVEELDLAKLNPLLRLKYHDSISDAVVDLGRPEEINRVFAGFQKYLYQRAA